MTAPQKTIGRRLSTEPYYSMVAQLRQWRVDPGIQELEKYRRKGRILAFVRGLRFAAQLIYALRVGLSGKNVDVSWGHVLDSAETLCSPECDIVIHRPGCLHHWNGTAAPVMDFKFIRKEDAIAVISCKSFLKQIDRDYPDQVKAYCSKVYLFAECCPAKKAAKLRSDAQAAGYSGFWYLYTMDMRTSVTSDDENEWVDFVKTLRAIC